MRQEALPTRGADMIKDRLKWEPGTLDAAGDKPKGMHLRTFDWMRAQHDAYVGVSIAGAVRRFGMIDGIDGIEELLRGT